MADLTDVMTALKGVIVPICYPTGTGNPSIIAAAIQVQSGWPLTSTLDALLANNQAIVSVYVHPQDRLTTRYLRQWRAQQPTPATITLTISGQTVIVGGAMPSTFFAHNLAVVVQGVAYTYALQPSDTLTSIATALAAAIAVGVAGTVSSGYVIALPNTANLQSVVVGTGGQALLELRRQAKRFQVSVWCNSPATRDTIAIPIDTAMAAINFLSMPDGSQAWVKYAGSMMDDGLQKAKLYRRDFFYEIEYATVQVATAPQIVTTPAGLAGSQSQTV